MRGVDELSDAPLADRAELGDGDRQQVHGERDRLAVEVTARYDVSAAGGDRQGVDDGSSERSRVVGAELTSISSTLPDVIQGVDGCAVYLGNQRIE